MCGIAGVLDPAGVDADDVRAMAEAQAHRGPDDATVHLEPCLGLGFRRLSIIDLEGGRQPIANEDDSVRVILNGEIYNYLELRKWLRSRGHRFATRTDTEVLVHLYEEKGAALVDDLRGMFAFALWDGNRRRLTLARDHLGQKPLYWARHGPRFWFASEIKGILAADERFRTLDPRALHEYLSIRVVSEPRSMFEGVRKLPAGHLMEIEPGERPSSRRYWNLRYEPKTQLGEQAAIERLDRKLRDTVKLHLRSDVEVGAFLSGGIDSGLVTAMMASIVGEGFKTFSVGTPYGDDDEFDETPAARATARRYGTDHHERTMTGEDLALLPSLVHHLDEPSDPLSACTWSLAGMASQQVKVALGGDGGDELFGGYDRYYGTRYARYWAMLPSSLRDGVIGRVLDWAPDGFWYKSLTHQLRWLNELAGVDENRRYPRSLSYFYFTPELRKELYTDRFETLTGDFDPEEGIAYWQQEGNAREALDRMLLADSMVRLPNHPVMILDRMTMAHGLEARSPFLDHELAEFCATLPVDMKVRGRKRRWIQMRLAERYLPDEVTNRPKQGFASAVPYMMDRQFRRLFSDFLPNSRLVTAGLLRGDTIRRMLDEHLGGRRDHGNRLWLLLNAEIWYRMKVEDSGVGEMKDRIESSLGTGDDRGRQRVAATA